jgi:2-oxoglutarate dehydrogenase E2 component (dihydrolipoamide succinyltransferase)
MAVDLKVPEMGEAVSEVYIGQWQKKEGERVEPDEALVEIESDKATLDLRAPAGGILTKILKRSGEQAEVGEVIGRIDEHGAATTPKDDAKKTGAKPEKEESKKEEARPEPKAAEKVEVATEKIPEVSDDGATKAAPKTEESKKVVDEELEGRDSQEAKAEPSPKAVTKAEAVVSKPVEAAERGGRSERREPMSPIRRRIAARLVEAQQNTALLTTFNEADMTAVKALRAEHGEAFEKRHKVRLGFMAFFVKAAVDALRPCPELNAIIDGDSIVYRDYYDIGVAISTEKGLVVPILRDAERMSFGQIEQSIADFANRARAGELKVDELQGGTFTITNGGVFGSLLSTPIVNPPQSGVLGMHAIQDRPVVVEGQIVVRPMMYVALTYDHRIVDGKEAVTFLRRIKETVEQPARLLIEV